MQPEMQIPHQPPTAQGRGVPVIIGWHGLMIVLSAVAALVSVTVGEAALNLAGIGLSVWLIAMLRARSKRAVVPAGLDAILAPIAVIHDVVVWDMPGGDGFKHVVGFLMMPLAVISLGIYLYIDRLRRHWYLT